MTGNELLTYALAHLGEGSASAGEYDYAVAAMNVILSEIFDAENRKRILKKQPLLEKPARLNTADENIDYDERLLTDCASYGLAAKLTLEDGDYARFNYLNGMYINAAVSMTAALKKDILDVYKEWVC